MEPTIDFKLEDVRYDVVNDPDDCQEQTFDSDNDLQIENPQPLMALSLAAAHYQRYFCFKVTVGAYPSDNNQVRAAARKIFATRQSIKSSVEVEGLAQAVTLDTYYDRQLFNWRDDLGETAIGTFFLVPGLGGLVGQASKGALKASLQAVKSSQATGQSGRLVKLRTSAGKWMGDDSGSLNFDKLFEVMEAATKTTLAKRSATVGRSATNTEVEGLRTVGLFYWKPPTTSNLSRLHSHISDKGLQDGLSFFLNAEGKFQIDEGIRALESQRLSSQAKRSMELDMESFVESRGFSSRQLEELENTYWTLAPTKEPLQPLGPHPSGLGQQFVEVASDQGGQGFVWRISRLDPSKTEVLFGNIAYQAEASLFNHGIEAFEVASHRVGANSVRRGSWGVDRLVAVPTVVTDATPIKSYFVAGRSAEKVVDYENSFEVMKNYLGAAQFEAVAKQTTWTKVQGGLRGWTTTDKNGQLRIIDRSPKGETLLLDVWAIKSGSGTNLVHPAEAMAFNHGLKGLGLSESAVTAVAAPVRIAKGGSGLAGLATFTMLPFLTAMSSGDVSEGAGVSGNQEHSDSRSLLDHYPSLHVAQQAERTSKSITAPIFVTLPRLGQYGEYSLESVQYAYARNQSECGRQVFEDIGTSGHNQQGALIHEVSPGALRLARQQIDAVKPDPAGDPEIMVYSLPVTHLTGNSHLTDFEEPHICLKVNFKVTIDNRADQELYRIFLAPNPMPIGVGL